MNIYFLVEGSETETKVYPKWLGHLLPSFERVHTASQATSNNYYLFSGKGYYRLLGTVLDNSIEDIILTNNFDYLVICVDADNRTVEETISEVQTRIEEIKEKMKYTTESNEKIPLELPERTSLKIIVQNRCIETWFLGNREMYSDNPKQKQLKKYSSLYNVKELDPERMPSYESNLNVSKFHKKYLELMFIEKKERYLKHRTHIVGSKMYLDQLIKRQEETNHLQSFKTLIDFCRTVAQQSQTTTQQ